MVSLQRAVLERSAGADPGAEVSARHATPTPDRSSAPPGSASRSAPLQRTCASGRRISGGDKATGRLLARSALQASGGRGYPVATGEAADQADALDAGAPTPAGADGPSLPGAPAACIVNAALPYARSGIKRDATGTVGEEFEVRVEWAPTVGRGEASYCAAECGEYHQSVKGHALSSPNPDGSNLTDMSAKLFSGLPLDENQFREDGLDSNPQARYGHRSERQTMDEKYEPDRAAGTRYTGKDFPNVSIGTFADLDLTFRGDIVDTCNNIVMATDTWRVQYRGLIRP